MATPGLGMTSPKSLSGMNASNALLQKRWQDNQLYKESVLGDPIIGNSDLISPLEVGEGVNRVPKMDSMIIELVPKGKKERAARLVELVFLKALSMAPREGNGEALLQNEATLQLKRTNAYANDWKGGVTSETFGIDFRELDAYDVYKEVRPLLGQWLSEVRGLYLRQALMTGISQNLTKAPVSLTAGITANWYFPGLSFAQQPAYDATTQNLVNNVGVAANTIYGSNNHLTVPELLKLIDYMRDTLYIEPITVAGKPMYIGYLSTDEMRRMRDPSVTGSWGTYWNSVGAVSDVKKIVPAAEVTIGDELILARDPRYVTMTRTGTASAYNLTFGYMKYGRVSTRQTNRQDGCYDVNTFFGKGALASYEPELPHYENQKDAYSQFNADGLFGAVGYKAIKWDLDDASATSSSAQQEGFVNVVTSRQ